MARLYLDQCMMTGNYYVIVKMLEINCFMICFNIFSIIDIKLTVPYFSESSF